jgi:hypothetical protein
MWWLWGGRWLVSTKYLLRWGRRLVDDDGWRWYGYWKWGGNGWRIRIVYEGWRPCLNAARGNDGKYDSVRYNVQATAITNWLRWSSRNYKFIKWMKFPTVASITM